MPSTPAGSTQPTPTGRHSSTAQRGAPAPDRAGDDVRTPDDLADELCDVPNTDLRYLPPGALVLEPSAGDGALVSAIRRANPGVRVVAVEPDPGRAVLCAADHAAHPSAVLLHPCTFEQYAATVATERTVFDAVVMRPPWAAAAGELGSGSDLWLEHVRLAWRLLRPGGWLVAVVPDCLAWRSNTQQRQAWAFFERHGSHTPLPADAFAVSGPTIRCRVARLAKPLRTSRPEYLLTTPQQPAVRVERPVFTGAAAAGRPVQVWSGGWGGRDRVARYRGRCAGCRWLLWGCDDGDNDPRGVLGEFSAGYSLDPDEYGMTGPQIGLCHRCGNDGERLRAAYQRAVPHWTQPAQRASREAREQAERTA